MDPTRIVFKRFKAQGLTLNSEAMKALNSVLQQQEDIEQSLTDILEAISKRIEKREGEFTRNRYHNEKQKNHDSNNYHNGYQ